MKFMMVFEGVDRATKIMNKIMSAEKKAAASIKAGANASAAAADQATRATERQGSAWSKVQSAARSATDAISSGAKAAARGISNLHNATLTLAKAGIGQIGDGYGKALRGITLGTALAASAFGAASLAAGSMVGTASQFEKFQTILETTEGSAAKARDAMGWVAAFAAKTPYELAEVNEAFVAMRSYGIDPTNGALQALGDTSAAMGKPLMQAVEAMADAVTGENERLKEFGITASKTGNKIVYSYTDAAGKMQTASVKATDRMAIQTKLMEIFNQKYGGAMEKLSGTWVGMISNLSDIWAQFQLSIMNAGLFDWMKDKLRLVLDTINQMKADGTLDVWAKAISDRIIFVLDNAWTFAKGVWEVFKTLGGYLQTASDYVGGWENLAIVLAGIAFGPALISTAAGLVQIASGLAMLGGALLANPIGLAVLAIAGGAALIYTNWEPIKTFFIELWNSMSSAVSSAWESVKSALAWHPLAMIAQNWGGISAAVKDALAAVPGLVSKAWETVKSVFAWHPAVIIIQNWGAIVDAVRSPVQAAFAAVDGVWQNLKSLFDWSPIEAIKQAWAGLSDAVGGFIDDAAGRAGAAWGRLKAAFSWDSGPATVSVADPATIQAAAEAAAKLAADMNAIAGIDTTGAMGRLAEIDNTAKKLAPVVTTAVAQAEAVLANTSFYNHGAALMDTMAAGMRARAAVVVEEIRRTMQQVRDHLPSSPAKTGPLSDIHKLKFGETIAASIRAQPMVNAMRAASAATMAAAAITAPEVAAAGVGADAARAQVARATTAAPAASSGPVQLTFSPNISIPAGATGNPADLKAAVQQALRESAREMADMFEEEMRRRGRRQF